MEIKDINVVKEEQNRVVQLDVRGTKIKVNYFLLASINSAYFRNILKTHKDVYYIDCNADVFNELLGYVETNVMPTNVFNPKYVKAVADKLDIPLTLHKKKSILTSTA